MHFKGPQENLAMGDKDRKWGWNAAGHAELWPATLWGLGLWLGERAKAVLLVKPSNFFQKHRYLLILCYLWNIDGGAVF